MPRYALVTFDAYSALVDRKSSLVPVLMDVLGLPAERSAEVLTLWRAKQMERAALSNALGKGRTPFRACTRLGLDYAARAFDLAITPGQRDALVRAWDSLRPWPEANETLAAVRAKGYPIAILSNGDRAMLEALAQQFDVAFDHVFSSETAGFYKPHPRVYRLPAEALGTAGAPYLHVAGSANDALGAKAAGVRCYWSNRAGDSVLDPAYAPDFQGPTLAGVLDVL